MKTCETCRFMAATRDGNFPLSEHATCARIIHGNGAKGWKSAKELAVVVDGSGYAARLCVLPTFGCVLHEPKEAP